MNKKVLGSVDELTSKVFDGLKNEITAWGEPQTFIDVISFDDEDETLVSVRFTEEHEDLSPEEYFYRAEIVISTNDDIIDDDMSLVSNGLGIDNIRELISNVLNADFEAYLS